MLVKSKVKYIQTLGHKKFRDDEGVFIAEGPKLVKDLLGIKTVVIIEVFATKDWITENADLLQEIPVIEITEADLEKISHLTTPNKVLAIVRQFDNGQLPTATGKVTLVLDNLQDPGNLGTIIRTADWFGVQEIICSLDTADLYNPKVVQSTMGSLGRVKVFYTDLSKWLSAQKDVGIFAATLKGKDITGIAKVKEAIIVIGNESKGVSAEILNLADVNITIPQKGKAESLNAAVAAGIILSHLVI